MNLGIDDRLCSWLLDFLLERQQVVKLGINLSEPLVLNTRAPQGCVLSPQLYSFFTYDCTADDESSIIVKFADDTTLGGFIVNDDEAGYRQQVQKLVDRCESNNLMLNVQKTKEMIIDFKKIPSSIEPLIINNEEVEIVNVFKFLGCLISNDLKWTNHIDDIMKKSTATNVLPSAVKILPCQ